MVLMFEFVQLENVGRTLCLLRSDDKNRRVRPLRESEVRVDADFSSRMDIPLLFER